MSFIEKKLSILVVFYVEHVYVHINSFSGNETTKHQKEKALTNRHNERKNTMFTRNQIQLSGNIAKTAETRTAGETTVTRARLIHNDVIRRADGETVERLVAVDVEIWGKRGTAFAEHITTKTPVFVEGKLQLDQWQAEDGSPRSRLLVRVDDWQFLAARPQEGNAPETNTASESNTASKSKTGNGKTKAKAAA